MQKVIAPKLDLQTTEVEILKWRKHEGDQVAQGEVILEIATEKATVDIEAPESGMLQAIAYREGERVKVGETLAYITSENEQIPKPAAAPPAAGSLRAPKTAPQQTTASAIRSTPAARQLCKQNSVTVEEVYQAAGKEPVTEKEVQSYLASRGGQRADEFEEVPLSYRRKIIARRMQESARNIPHIHLFAEVCIDPLTQQKGAHTRSGGKITLTDLFIRILGRVLSEFPPFNATYVEQGTEGALRQYRQVNIGLAVSTEFGLVVPVLKDVTNKPLAELMREKEGVISRARNNRLAPEDLSEATFTFSNLGEFQITQFTAIINPPQVAILSIGRAIDRLTLAAGKPQLTKTAGVCLGLDHRALDGADGGRFLTRFKELVEEPPEDLFS